MLNWPPWARTGRRGLSAGAGSCSSVGRAAPERPRSALNLQTAGGRGRFLVGACEAGATPRASQNRRQPVLCHGGAGRRQRDHSGNGSRRGDRAGRTAVIALGSGSIAGALERRVAVQRWARTGCCSTSRVRTVAVASGSWPCCPPSWSLRSLPLRCNGSPRTASWPRRSGSPSRCLMCRSSSGTACRARCRSPRCQVFSRCRSASSLRCCSCRIGRRSGGSRPATSRSPSRCTSSSRWSISWSTWLVMSMETAPGGPLLRW